MYVTVKGAKMGNNDIKEYTTTDRQYTNRIKKVCGKLKLKKNKYLYFGRDTGSATIGNGRYSSRWYKCS